MYEEIKAEIERRMDYHYDKLPDADSPEEDWTHNELCELGAYMELEHLETFIESLDKEQYPLSTKKDIELIHTFLYAVKNNKQGVFTFTRLTDEQYEEVLRRFNNRPQD